MRVLFYNLDTSEIEFVDVDLVDGEMRMLLAQTLGGELLEALETDRLDEDIIEYGLDDDDDDEEDDNFFGSLGWVGPSGRGWKIDLYDEEENDND